MSNALNKINRRNTPATTKARTEQVRNNGGGYSFQTDDWNRLERFLIIGSDKGTYYVGEQKLTADNVAFAEKLLKTDANEVLRRIVEISDQGRARSNSQALFLLAYAMNTDGVDRAAVREAVLKVARTSTHLFEYAQYLDNLGGWGRSKRESISNWYTSKTPAQLALQVVKYRQRNGWTHRDLLRLAHTKGINPGIGNFILGKEYYVNEVPSLIIGFEKVQNARSENEVINLISEYGLPWEAIPTEWHKSLKVWRTIFEAGMGQIALLRNTVRFARLGAFNDMRFAKQYADKLQDAELIRKGRVHPINYLNAAVVFERGQLKEVKNSYYSWAQKQPVKNWETNATVLDGLQEGFYAAFGNIEPANKRTVVALDVSGSMGSWANGIDLTCAEVGAAIAMFILHTEPYCEIRGFAHQYVDLGITKKDTLATVLKKTRMHNFGSTNAALPMQHAQRNKQEVDTFVVITDNEVNTGRQPFQALKSYRDATGIAAREAVFGVTATPFSIADPNDAGSMDFVGFDSNAPRVLADFSAGRL